METAAGLVVNVFLRDISDRRAAETGARRLAALVDGSEDAMPNTSKEPILSALPVTAQAGIGSYVGVPLELSSGRTYGTLCCLSHDPDPAIAERHVDLMRFLANLASEEIERDERELTQRRALRSSRVCTPCCRH